MGVLNDNVFNAHNQNVLKQGNKATFKRKNTSKF